MKLETSRIINLFLFAIRVCLISSYLTFFSYQRFIKQLSYDEFLYGSIILGILFALATFSGFILNKTNILISKSCTVIDSLIITSLIYLGGLYYSQLITLIIIYSGIAAVLYGFKFGIFQALLNSLSYSALLFFTYRNDLLRFGELSENLPEINDIVFQVLVLVVASLLVTFFSSLLKSRVVKTIGDLNDKNIKLESDNQVLLEQLPIAIVICDETDEILKVSRNVQAVLGIKLNINENLFRQLKLSSNIKEFTISDKIMKLTERRVELASDARAVKMFTFEDITKIKIAEENLAQKNKVLSLGINNRLNDYDIVGNTDPIKNVIKLIDIYAKTNSNVLILGESGTGKELIAKAIHTASNRNGKPFVAVNCGAIPENLIESALFGHQKGSFTGASADQTGYFSQAEGGTLFLDEIGELPIGMQPKLLRALQEKKIRRIGAKSEEDIDVRIVAATNRDLKLEVDKGNFREDLYYRLNVLQIKNPSLRERKDDISLLISYFVNKSDKKNLKITQEALNCLRNYNFPGNIRELENIIERAIVLSNEEISIEHLPAELLKATETINTEDDSKINLPADLDQIVSELEKKYVLEAMKKSGGVKKLAAELLGINLRSLRYRLEKLGSDNWWFDS